MNTEELEKIINNFDKTKILVIGDLMLDRFIIGDVSLRLNETIEYFKHI